MSYGSEDNILTSSNWNNSSNTGLGNLNSNNVTSNNNRNIGTRRIQTTSLNSLQNPSERKNK